MGFLNYNYQAINPYKWETSQLLCWIIRMDRNRLFWGFMFLCELGRNWNTNATFEGPVRAEATKLFFTLTVKNVFAQLFLGWKLVHRQLVLIMQTDAIAEQLQLDHGPMRSEGIFSSPCLNYSCWAGSDPQVRDLAFSAAVWEVVESKTFPMAGSVRALAHHCLIWGWVWVPGNAQLNCGSLALLDFLPASNGVNDRKIWLWASLGSSLPLFGGVGSCFLPGEFATDHPCNYYQGSGFMRDLNTGFILLQTHCRESLLSKRV